MTQVFESDSVAPLIMNSNSKSGEEGSTCVLPVNNPIVDERVSASDNEKQPAVDRSVMIAENSMLTDKSSVPNPKYWCEEHKHHYTTSSNYSRHMKTMHSTEDRKAVLDKRPKYFCPQHKFVYKSRHTFRQHVRSSHKDDPNFSLPQKFDFYLVKKSVEGEEFAKQTSKFLEEKNSEEEEVSSDDLVDVTEDDDDDDDNGSCDSNSGDALHKLPSSKHEGSSVPVAFSEEDSFLGRIESGVNASVELFCRLRGAEMCRKVERSFLNDSYRFAVCNVVANNLAEQFSAENMHEKTAIADPAQLQSACFTSTTIDSLLAFHKKFLATQQSISSNMEKLKEYQRAINENIGKWHVKQAALQYASSTSKKRKFDE